MEGQLCFSYCGGESGSAARNEVDRSCYCKIVESQGFTHSAFGKVKLSTYLRLRFSNKFPVLFCYLGIVSRMIRTCLQTATFFLSAVNISSSIVVPE